MTEPTSQTSLEDVSKGYTSLRKRREMHPLKEDSSGKPKKPPKRKKYKRLIHTPGDQGSCSKKCQPDCPHRPWSATCHKVRFRVLAAAQKGGEDL